MSAREVADVILLSGPPGSGKTTTARQLARSYPAAVHLHTDDFWRAIVSGGVAPYLPESDTQNRMVMTAIQRTAWAYALGGFTTVVDGVVGPWMLTSFQPDLAHETTSPRVHYLVLRPGREETLRRAQARPGPDALVDERTVTDLWDQFAHLGYLERHVIDTTEHQPGESLESVREAVAGERYLLG